MRQQLLWVLFSLWMALLPSGFAQDTERTLTILMGEMFFQVEGTEPGAEIRLEALVQHRVLFRNVGQEVHRAKFGRDLITEGETPSGYEENLFDDVFVRIRGWRDGRVVSRIITDRLIELDLEPEEELELIFTFPRDSRGTWEIGCFVEGHYEAGMFASVIVE